MLIPPLFVPPLSVMTTVTVLVPKELVAVLNVMPPLVPTVGNWAKVAFVTAFVGQKTVNVQVWLLSFVGPATRLVKK